jgi:hypothetical protein
MTAQERTCPVCGYAELFDIPWVGGHPSDEICPCCGTHFGYDDFETDAAARSARHAALRKAWVDAGYPWFSQTRTSPPDWDPRRQLAAITA